jgi:stage II sporulation protein R
MRKKHKRMPVLAVIALIFTAALFTGMAYRYNTVLTNEDFIRFHVIANSDSEEDQELKLKVRDRLIEEINEGLIRKAVISADVSDEKASLDIDASREYITENISEIESAAQEIIAEEGYDYTVKAEFGVSWIPEKTYGSVTFPAGNYEALRILIGEAKGKNWWCVLYPPLCLIDSDETYMKQSETEMMQDIVMSERYRELTEAAESGRPAKMLHLRFKTLEILKKD